MSVLHFNDQNNSVKHDVQHYENFAITPTENNGFDVK